MYTESRQTNTNQEGHSDGEAIHKDPRSCQHAQREPHDCPWQVEVKNNANPTYCTCCQACEHTCFRDT